MSLPGGKPLLSPTGSGKLAQVVLGQQFTAFQPGISAKAQEGSEVVLVSSRTETAMTSIRPVPTSVTKRPPPSLFVGDLVKVTPQFAAEKTSSQDALKKVYITSFKRI